MTVSDQGGQASTPAQVPVKPVYRNAEEWVTRHFIPMFRRPFGGEFRWCKQWWRHAEAISRLTALWHSWETLRLQPGLGMATWLRDHLDAQLPELLGRSGPFAMCSEEEHIEMRQAEADEPPAGWWDTGTQARQSVPARSAGFPGGEQAE